MDEATRLRMRRGHLKYRSVCTCGKISHGNGGRASHRAMHKRKGDGHFSLTPDAHDALVKRGEWPCRGAVPTQDYLTQIINEDFLERKSKKT